MTLYEMYKDKGLYSNTITYFYNDQVEHDRRIYIMKNNKVESVIGINPENTKYWKLIRVKIRSRNNCW